ncbi:MAG: hypothetical protein HYV27_04640 [Candidatus Hydrogenedentes bacterium]|nr:hypothetical protein [Candidatus Hydrogenedentota bacterium]
MRNVLVSTLVFLLLPLMATALSPEDTAAWKSDLGILRATYAEQERSFTPETRAAFVERIDELERALPTLNHYEAVNAVLAAVALSDNGHCMVMLPRSDKGYWRLPVGLWWFADGLFVTRTKPEHKELLGKRVTAIGGVAPEELLSRLGALVPGTAEWKRYHSQRLMITPGILHGLGLSASPESATITCDGNGTPVSAEITAQPAPGLLEGQEFWWTLSPVAECADGPWLYAFDRKKSKVPLYLAQPNLAFTWEFLKKDRALYVQYNRSIPQRGLWPVKTIDALVKDIEKQKIERLIVDLRMNNGGNYYKMRGGFDDLLAVEAFKKPGSVYVLTGNGTFSAAIFHTAQFKLAGATLVGEPIGDRLDFWAEGDMVALPGSGLEIVANKGFHSYSRTPHPEHAEHLHTDLDVESLDPDIPASMSFAQYLAGEDPLLDAALAAKP